MCEQLADWQ